MFSLFELAKIITFHSPEASKNKSATTILQHAWKEVGERSILALLFSNGYLLLRHGGHRRPTLRQLPWYPDRIISGMTFDPSGTWLLTATTKGNLYVVPALALLEPGLSTSEKWRTDDVSRIKPSKKRGVYTCVAWWQTQDAEDIAVVGTKSGFVEVVELSSGNVAVEVELGEHVAAIDIVRDDSHATTYALVTTKSSVQWKLLLETKPPLADRQWARDNELEDMGFEKLDVSHLRNSIMNPFEDSARDFLPVKFEESTSSVTLSPQYARGRHFVAAHDTAKHMYKVFDSTVERSALFEYSVPEDALSVLLTDKLLFVATAAPRDGGVASMRVLANQFTEAAQNSQKFNQDSVLQEFPFSSDEHVITVYKRPYQFFWHERYGDERPLQEASTDGDGLHMRQVPGDKLSNQIALSSHSVLDGCMVLTNHALYKCRPRVSPERMFLRYILDQCDQSKADKLAIVCGLDINNLYQLAAHLKLEKGDVQQAARFFQQSKCSHRARIAAFARGGHVTEALTHLRATLEATELSSDDRAQLSDLMLRCYMHQLLTSRDKGVQSEFRAFLLKNTHYEESVAMRLLSNHGQWKLLIELSKSRGLLGDALDLMTTCGQKALSQGPLSAFRVDILPVDQIVESMSAQDLAAACCSRPSSAFRFLQSLRPCLDDLDSTSLLKVIRVFDPSTPQIQALLHKASHSTSSERSSSTSSLLTSFSSEASSEPPEPKSEADGLDTVEIVHFFIRAVLLYNSRRGFSATDVDLEDKSEAEAAKPTDAGESLQLSTRHRYVGCGHQHGAAICDGDVYVWGNTGSGRLGLGDVREKVFWQPQLVDALHVKGIDVQYVSCGAQHTMALSHSGIYGWGSNALGQVGVAGATVYRRPVQLDALNTNMCVAVSCGQYHTGALTHDARVFTWGWGVHGQLGHSACADVATPREMATLKDVFRIKGGYAHTLFLTVEGEVYAAGCGVLGQLGQGDINKSTLPKRVKGLTEPVAEIATKYFHNLALTRSGKVLQWGASPQNLRYTVQAHRKARQLQSKQSQARGVIQMTRPQEPLQLVDHLVPALVDTSEIDVDIVQVDSGTNMSVLLTCDGEVYTWGKNFDGQLGIGNRMEQKWPVMVTRINDRKVAHLSCGAECMVALDTEGIVWAWGRNDAGQIGMHQVEAPSYAAPYRGQGTKVTDCVLPTRVQGLPKPSSIIQAPWTIEEDKRGSMWYSSLGSLKGLDEEVPYPATCVLTLLQHLPEPQELAPVLSMCSQASAWGVAAQLCRRRRLYAQAFRFHLRHLVQQGHGEDQLQDGVAAAVSVYLSKVKEAEDGSQREASADGVLTELLSFWSENDLSVSGLENVLRENLADVQVPLFALLTKVKRSETASDAAPPPAAALLAQLSSRFQLQLTRSLVLSLERDQLGSEQLQQILPDPQLLVQPASDRPTDQLWQDVFQNLKKDINTNTCIHLSADQVQTLVESCDRSRGLDAEIRGVSGASKDAEQSCDAVVFTCGHHYTRENFLLSVVPSFEANLSEAPNNIPQTAALLSGYYRNRGEQPMACPRCVLATIQSS